MIMERKARKHVGEANTLGTGSNTGRGGRKNYARERLEGLEKKE